MESDTGAEPRLPPPKWLGCAGQGLNIFEPHFSKQQNSDDVFSGLSRVLSWCGEKAMHPAYIHQNVKSGASESGGNRVVNTTSQGYSDSKMNRGA